MILLDDKVEVSWNVKNKDHYINNGYIFTKFNDKFYVNISDLKENSNAKIKVSCDYCGKEYYIPYFQYRRSICKHPKIACQECSGNKIAEYTLERRRNNMYREIISFCDRNEYKLLTEKDELTNTKSEVKYICPVHGEVTTKVTSILSGKKCYRCSRHTALLKKASTTLHDRQQHLYSKALDAANSNGYTLLTNATEINKNTDIIKYSCPTHGIHSMRISNFINGRKCPDCAIERIKECNKMPYDQVENRIRKYGGLLLNKKEYKNSSCKNLRIVCPECGDEFVTSFNNFCQHNGQVCERCSGIESMGERRIRHFLDGLGIKYEQEKWFSDCRDIKPLPFDFYLPELNIIIEYDGKQHYTDRGYKRKFYSDTLEYTQKHDAIKNEYCQISGFKLIRIPYWEFNNIEKILAKNLHEDIV